MTPLFNEADENLLRALPNETRRAVVELVGRSWQCAILDTAECIRAAVKDFHAASVMRIVLSDLADSMARRAFVVPAIDIDIPTPDPTTLSDAEILDLPPIDRAKVLADLASQGLILAVMLVDVGVPCPHCDGGKVSMVIDGLQQRVDCTRCDGLGVVDGRRRCADRECLSHGEPLVYSLAGGWACSRKHGHGKPPLPLGRPSGSLMSEAEVEAELQAAGWRNTEPIGWRHPITGTYHATSDAHALLREARAAVVNVDTPAGADTAPVIEPDEDAGSYLTAPCNLDGSLSIAERFGLE